MPKDFKSLAEVLTGEKGFSNFRKSVKENDVVVMFGPARGDQKLLNFLL